MATPRSSLWLLGSCDRPIKHLLIYSWGLQEFDMKMDVEIILFISVKLVFLSELNDSWISIRHPSLILNEKSVRITEYTNRKNIDIFPFPTDFQNAGIFWIAIFIILDWNLYSISRESGIYNSDERGNKLSMLHFKILIKFFHQE